MAFRDIAGNERVKRILQTALKRRRLPPSLLFAGPAGTGKLETAVTLAKALNCQKLEDDSCDQCPSCRAIDEDFQAFLAEDTEKIGHFPDVGIISRAYKVIQIDQIRYFLKDAAYLRPMSARRRVFIVDEADRMNPESRNSILKVLEEPPETCQIILTTENRELMPATVLSRCQTLTFSPLSAGDIETILRNEGCPEDRAGLLAALSAGNLDSAREAEEDWEGVTDERDAAWTLFRGLLPDALPSAFLDRFANVFGANQGDDLRKALETFASFARDLLLLASGGDDRRLLNPDRAADLRETAARMTVPQALALAGRVGEALAGYDRNFNKSLLAASLAAGVEG